jgi:hypothetical protein
VGTYLTQYSGHWLYLWACRIYTTGSSNGEMGVVSHYCSFGILVVEGTYIEKEVEEE